jgi:hypothetical protein
MGGLAFGKDQGRGNLGNYDVCLKIYIFFYFIVGERVLSINNLARTSAVSMGGKSEA